MKNVGVMETRLARLQELFPDPGQPRQDFDQVEMEKLKESISQKGIMNPLVVEPKGKNKKHLIVDGERRFRIAEKLNLKTVPINVLKNTLSESDRNIIRFQLQETHKSWSPFEKADALYKLKLDLGLTNDDLAKALALSRVTVDRYLSILSFAPKSRIELTKYKLPFTYIEVMSYTNNILPSSIAKKIPNWIPNLVKKYRSGILTRHEDFRVINRLIRKGEYKVVEKFLSDNNYTANNALIDSGDQKTQLEEKICRAAKTLFNDLKIAEKNNIKLSHETNIALDNLAKFI